MIHPPYPIRCPDDDSGAPVDYSYVSSVNEGRRRAQQKNIHEEDEQAGPRPLIRHRADPYDRERVDAYGTRAPMRSPDRSGTVQTLPTREEEAIPENPYDRPAARRRSQPLQEPQVIVTEDGSQFDPPAMAKLPEWYRVAQQNASTTDDRMRRAPKVQAAPRVEVEEDDQPVQYDPLGCPWPGGRNPGRSIAFRVPPIATPRRAIPRSFCRSSGSWMKSRKLSPAGAGTARSRRSARGGRRNTGAA